jgi:hypothetical protein
MGVNVNVGFLWFCIVLFMAIQAMGDQITGTFLIYAIVTLSFLLVL